MKKIKKLLTILLAVLLMLCMSVSLVGCKDFDKKATWYSEKALSWGNLENLPKPTYQYKGYDSTSREVKGGITENDFQQYAQQLLDYMYGKFEYLGTSGVWLQNPNVYNPDCQFVRCGRNLEEYRKEQKNSENETYAISYLFVYFIDAPAEREGGPDYSTEWYVEITYYLTEQTYREKDDGEYKDKYTYNFEMQLKKYGVSTFYIYTDYAKKHEQT